MKKVIQFTKIRFIMFTISLILIAGGIVGTIANGGFNLGIDFQAGLNQRVQITPSAFKLGYTGTADVTVDVARGSLTLSVSDRGAVTKSVFEFTEYTTLKALSAVISDIDGFSVETMISDLTPTAQIVGFSYPVEMEGTAVTVNYVEDSADPVEIEEVRSVLAELGSPQIQIVGDPLNQEFSIRVQDPGEDKNFSTNMSAKVVELLSDKYGAENIIVKQIDYVGARFSGELGNRSFFYDHYGSGSYPCIYLVQISAGLCCFGNCSPGP